MKIIHQNGFSDKERADYRPIIYKNLMESAQAVVLAMRKVGVAPEGPANRVRGPCLRATVSLVADRSVLEFRTTPTKSWITTWTSSRLRRHTVSQKTSPSLPNSYGGIPSSPSFWTTTRANFI